MFVFVVVATPSSTSREADITLPEKYKANTLSEHRPYNCPIDLQPGKEPPWGPIYNLSPVQLTHKDQPFIWSSDAAKAFKSLK